MKYFLLITVIFIYAVSCGGDREDIVTIRKANLSNSYNSRSSIGDTTQYQSSSLFSSFSSVPPPPPNISSQEIVFSSSSISSLSQTSSFSSINSSSIGSAYSAIVDPRDNQVYEIVQIGTQVWFAENLKAEIFNDLVEIDYVGSSVEWSSTQESAFTWYDSYVTTRDKYGGLYNWYAVETGNLCPEGWRVPSSDDWEVLITHVGSSSNAGGKLKQAGTFNWNSPNTAATNEFGFNAMPGGRRHPENGSVDLIKDAGGWWTSTVANETRAWHYYMTHNSSGVMKSEYNKRGGFSVRCIRD